MKTRSSRIWMNTLIPVFGIGVLILGITAPPRKVAVEYVESDPIFVKDTRQLPLCIEKDVILEGYIGDELTGREHLPGLCEAIILEDGTAVGLGMDYRFVGDPFSNNLNAMYLNPNKKFQILGRLVFVDLRHYPELQDGIHFVHSPVQSFRIVEPSRPLGLPRVATLPNIVID